MSASATRPLLSANAVHPTEVSGTTIRNGAFFRDPSSLSAKDVGLQKFVQQNGESTEETLFQVEIVNPELERKVKRTQLGSKNQCLTRRWQTALVTSLILVALAAAIGGLAYWITLPKVITQPFLLYGESCYMNSRSCDDTRMLWCPNGTCLCRGNFHWNSTGQNCSCDAGQQWVGTKCMASGSYGDPCSVSFPCKSGLTCQTVINQTYTTGQSICDCNNVTYYDTLASPKACAPRLTHNATCLTKFDCQDWLGLACTNTSSSLKCLCGSNYNWNGSYCARNALGWEACGPRLCDTTVGLSCVSGICECDSRYYWDNVTTLSCLEKKTYAVACQYTFQCNTTVNLTCPSNTTGCNCPIGSGPNICDCQSGQFWDGQRCSARHTFNGTCPGQYACTSNLVCFLGHCICPGNMIWNTVTPNTCACALGTTWNSITSTCI